MLEAIECNIDIRDFCGCSNDKCLGWQNHRSLKHHFHIWYNLLVVTFIGTNKFGDLISFILQYFVSFLVVKISMPEFNQRYNSNFPTNISGKEIVKLIKLAREIIHVRVFVNLIDVLKICLWGLELQSLFNIYLLASFIPENETTGYFVYIALFFGLPSTKLAWKQRNSI